MFSTEVTVAFPNPDYRLRPGLSAHPSVIGRQRNSRREDQSSGSQIADSAYVIGRIWHNLLKHQDGELDPPDFMQSERQLSTVCVRKLPFRSRPA